MDYGLVRGSQSETEGGGGVYHPTSPFPYTDVFYRHFPYYLSIGMTAEQYWEQDSCLVEYYREAEKLRRDKINEEAWLQGMYVYDAIIRIAPVLHAFAKKGTKPQPYVEEPYPISKKKVEDAKKKKEKKATQTVRSFLETFMVKNNKRFEERK